MKRLMAATCASFACAWLPSGAGADPCSPAAYADRGRLSEVFPQLRDVVVRDAATTRARLRQGCFRVVLKYIGPDGRSRRVRDIPDGSQVVSVLNRDGSPNATRRARVLFLEIASAKTAGALGHGDSPMVP